ncbi:MAG: hypothetical protein HC795_06980 [Coleofasciculaceae cyanobacterium RL_1_1]|nr:hypothetical protein [Coleofasciculaceae cyanobacterium RL_1_1]
MSLRNSFMFYRFILSIGVFLSLLAPIAARAETQNLPGDNPGQDAIDDVVGGSDRFSDVDDVTDDVDQITGTVDDVANDVDAILDDPDAVVDDVVQGTQDQIDSTIDGVTGAADDAIDGVTDGIDAATDADSVGGVVGGVTDAIGSVTDGIDSILGQIDSAIDGFLNIFDQLGLPDIGQVFDDIDSVFGGGSSGDGDDGSLADGSVGAMGIPDPNVVLANIEDRQTSPADELLGTKQGGDGSPVVKDDTGYTFDIELARETANASALGEDAQDKLQANGEMATTALETSRQLAEDSEGQDVSQNILRNLSAQTAASQQTDTLLALDAQARARDDAIRNRLNANALAQLQRERAAQRQTDASAFSSALTQGGQFFLPGFPTEEDSDSAGDDTP